MHYITTYLRTLLGLLVLVGMMTAAPRVGSAASPFDSAEGSVKVTNDVFECVQHINFSAHSGPSGEDPKGQVHLTVDCTLLGGTFKVKGDVTCLNVVGSVASIIAELDEPVGSNTHITLLVMDNGKPQQGLSPDQVFFGLTSTPPATCDVGGTTLAGEAHGNAVVHDATP
jgi:hypothetical protein